MKKVCILLCLTVLMLSFSVVADATPPDEAPRGTGFSAPAVCIVPAEQDVSLVSVQGIVVACGLSARIISQSYAVVDKYIPYIMEQINIISVAPRE